MGGLEGLIPPLAQWLGVQPSTLLLFIGVIVAVANLVGRLIPDDAIGGLAVLRKLCKIIGLYVSPRVSSGVSVADVAKASMGVPAKPAVVESMQDAGVLPDDAPKLKSPWIVTLATFIVVILTFGLLSGCAATTDIQLQKNACAHQIVLRYGATQVIDNPKSSKAAIAAAQATLDVLDRCPPAIN